MHSILSALNQTSSNIAASAIVSKDGLVIASILPEDMNENHLGGITAALFSVGFRSTQQFAGGAEQMMVKGSQGYILMTHAGKEAFLTVITKTHAELDHLFVELKHSAKKVTDCMLASH